MLRAVHGCGRQMTRSDRKSSLENGLGQLAFERADATGPAAAVRYLVGPYESLWDYSTAERMAVAR